MLHGSEPGTMIAGRYRVERELGRGGMAVVLLAHDEVHERSVALKILRQEMSGAVNAERFLREIRLLGRLQHPHILPMFDSGMLGDLPFLVMPYIAGETLRARMRRERQMALADVLAIAADVLDAMQHAHEQDIIHRDIKPENILLSSGRAYVADFGVARAIHRAGDEPATSAGLAVGTPTYMSPEQASAEGELDGRSDVYAFGCVLFEMLAGIPPFVAATAQGAVARRFYSPAPSVRELRDQVPEHVADAIARALSRAPADRFESAAAMRRALIEPTAPHRARHAPSRVRIGRAPLLAAAGGLVVVTLAFAASRLDLGPPPVEELVADGRSAVLRWQPESALIDLRSAVSRAPNAPQAQLWFAQAGHLLPRSADTTWKWAARRAAALGDQLTEPERARAIALAALADGRYPEACAAFEHLGTLQPLDPGALIGAGDCQALDAVVLADAGSPSGWRFRGSYRTAAARYLMALERYPEIAGVRPIALARLERVLHTDPNRSLRFGRADGAATMRFAGQQALVGDTLAFIPYPVEQLDVGGSGMHAAGATAIAERNRTLLRHVALSWTELAPTSPEAHEALGRALEATGEIVARHADAPSAIASIRLARRYATDSVHLVNLAHQHTRFLLRAGDFTAARALADTVLERWPSPNSAYLHQLSSLAALTGRTERVVEILRSLAAELEVRLADGRMYRPNPELGASALTLQGFAAMGGPVDSITSTWRRLESQLDSYVSAADRHLVRDAIASRSLSLAAPVTGPELVRDVSGEFNYLIRMQQMLARGERGDVLQALRELERLRRDRPASAVSPDATYLEATLYALAGDTAAAVRHLDRMLNALPALGVGFLDDAIGAGTFVRSMRLRVQLGSDSADEHGSSWRRAADMLQERPPTSAPLRDRRHSSR